MEHISSIVKDAFRSAELRYASKNEPRLSKQEVHFQLISNSLEGRYLKDCLKSLNQAKEFSAYHLSASELTGFVKIWLESNQSDSSNIPDLFVKPDGHAKKLEEKLALPHIHSENGKCSESWHYETIHDMAGRLRCAQVSRPPHFRKKEFCYQIISDIGVNLPLETILTRLDESSKLDQTELIDKLKTIFPFDSHTLALYVKKWYLQNPDELNFH